MKKKLKELEKGLGIKDSDSKVVAVPYVIDCNKRTTGNKEPRMTD